MSEDTKRMKVKIVSDGTANGTKVLDENGDMIRHVTGVEFVANAETRFLKLTVLHLSPEIEIGGPADVVLDTEKIREDERRKILSELEECKKYGNPIGLVDQIIRDIGLKSSRHILDGLEADNEEKIPF